MVKKTIYIVRHGETDYNKQGLVQGSGIDLPLNLRGQAQAQAFYEVYHHISFDAVYTSLLQRTRQSVELFIGGSTFYKALSGLNEIDWGKQEGSNLDTANNSYYQTLNKQWREGLTHLCVEGGESPEDVAQRQQNALKFILQQEKHRNILICAHGRAIRVALCLLLHYPLSAMDIFMHQNLGLYVLHYTGYMCMVDKFNDGRHLRGI